MVSDQCKAHVFHISVSLVEYILHGHSRIRNQSNSMEINSHKNGMIDSIVRIKVEILSLVVNTMAMFWASLITTIIHLYLILLVTNTNMFLISETVMKIKDGKTIKEEMDGNLMNGKKTMEQIFGIPMDGEAIMEEVDGMIIKEKIAGMEIFGMGMMVEAGTITEAVWLALKTEINIETDSFYLLKFYYELKIKQ